MNRQNHKAAESQSTLSSLQVLDPSPVVSPSPSPSTLEKGNGDYFPSSDTASESSHPSLARSSTSTLGLSGVGGHGVVYYLTRLHKYSSYAIAPFLALHISNTSLLPLLTRSLPASDTYLLLTRPYYQSLLAEPLVVLAPILTHVTSGIALRLYRRHQLATRYGADTHTLRRRLAWPRLSGTSALGYALIPLVLGHAFVNRILPLYVDGGSSGVGLGYVAHGFARSPWSANLAYALLTGVGALHFVWGAARWMGWAPAQMSGVGQEAERRRRRRRWVVNAVSAVVAGLWMAGGLGVVGRGGETKGWLGRGYDALYRRIPVIGRWIIREDVSI
ncbi:MAG: hypothetical protein M1817_002828 [Caeruleum heppii]|nr:MAG: hypothetical protein M1817_002828 [Caeruleum heppii]